MSAAECLDATASDIEAAVTDREFRRLLGLPRKGEVPEQVAATMRNARRWYAAHGEPFVAARRIALESIGRSSVTLAGGGALAGEALAVLLASNDARAVVAVAASAGASVAMESARLWADGRPDEAYALDRLAAAVAERLLLHAFSTLCESYSPAGEQLTRHLSPGCGGWEIDRQRDVMRLLNGNGFPDAASAGTDALGPVTLLESGALSPQHSVLAMFGVSGLASTVTPEACCRACDLDPCSFRRVPPARENDRSEVQP